MGNQARVESTVQIDDWRFTFDGGHMIDAENLSGPDFERRKLFAPAMFRHSDLEMFARGWVAAVSYA